MSIFGKMPYIEGKLGALSDEQLSTLATAINSSADDATVYSLTDLRALSQDTIGAAKIQFNPACLRAGYLILKYNSFCTFITNELYYTGKATVYDIDLSNLKYNEIKEDCTVEEVRRILAGGAGSGTIIDSVSLTGMSGTLSDADYAKLLLDNCVIKVGTQNYYKAFDASTLLIYQAFSRQAGQDQALYDYVEITKSTKAYEVKTGNMVEGNPTLSGAASTLTSLKVGETYYTNDGVVYKSGSTVQSNPLKFVKMTATQYSGITPDADTFYIIVGE